MAAAALVLVTGALLYCAQDPARSAPVASAAAPSAAPSPKNGDSAAIVGRIVQMFDLYADRTRSLEASQERGRLHEEGCRVDAEHLPALLASASAARARIAAEDVRQRAWFEQAVGATLVDCGHSAAALAGLDEFVHGLEIGDLSDGDKGRVSAALALYVDLLRIHGDYDTAIRVGKDAVDIRPQDTSYALDPARPNRLAIARARSAHALGALAETYLHVGLPEAAAPLVLEQQRLAKLSERPDALARAASVMASYHRLIGRPEAVIRALEGPAGAQSANEIWLSGLALRDLSLRDPERRGEAVATLRQAIALAGLAPSQQVEAQVVLADLQLAAGDLEAAAGALAAARALLDSSRSIDRSSDQAARIAALEGRTRRLGLSGLAGEELQARLDGLRPAVTLLRAAFEAILRDWDESTPRRRAGLGFLTPQHRRVVLSELVELVWAIDGEAAAATTMLDCLLEVQRLSSLARELGVAVASPAEIRRDFLRPGDGVLLLLPSQYQSYVLAFDRDQLRIFRLAGWAELLSDVDAYRDELHVSPAGRSIQDLEAWAQGLQIEGRALTRRILDDEVLDLLARWRSVTVADTGLLRGLPLECLVLADGRLLGEAIAVNTLDSLPLGRHLRQVSYRPGTVGEVTLDVLATLQAAPEFDPGATGARSGPVRFGADRVDQLSGSYASHHELLDEQFTVRALQGRRFDASVAHIVAHGARMGARERAIGLALTPEPGHDNGWFGAEQADALAASGRVPGVILISACGAARGRRRIGDANYQTTLAASFLRAGAHTVVQSAADLVLGPHLALMAEVHRQLTNGATTAEALRRARVARTGPLAERFRHAQVQVFGLGSYPLVTARASRSGK